MPNAIRMGKRRAIKHDRKGQEVEALTSRDINRLRNDLYRIVRDAMPQFRNLIMGNLNGATSRPTEWSPTRLKAFALALSRLVPEASLKDEPKDPRTKPIAELTFEELELIAKSGVRAQTPIVDTTFNEAPRATPAIAAPEA